MKTLKMKAALLALPLVVAALTGCGSQNNTSGAVQIKLWHTWGQTIIDAVKSKAATFKQLVKENDGVDVEVTLIYQGGYDDILTKTKKGYSVGNKPTIAVAYPDHVSDYLDIGKAANDQFVVNLEQYSKDSKVGFGKEDWLGDKKHGEEDFIEGYFQEGQEYSVKGLYSIPFMKSTEIMFYNYDIVEAAMPYYNSSISGETNIKNFISNMTWDQLTEFARSIKEHAADIGISGSLDTPVAYDSDANLFITKMYQNGIPYSSINDQGQGSIDFNKTGNIERTTSMLEKLWQMHKDGLLTTKGIKGTYSSDFFTNEECVFTIGSSGGAGYNFPQQDSFRLGVAKVPYDNNNPKYVTQGVTLALFSDNGLDAETNEMAKLYGYKFIKFLTNTQNNAELCVNGSEGYAPVRYSCYETSFFQDFMAEPSKYQLCYKVVTEDVNDAGYLATPCFKGSADLRDACGSLLTAALNASSKDSIPGLIQKAAEDAALKM